MDSHIVLVITLIMEDSIWCSLNKNHKNRCYLSINITNYVKYPYQIKVDRKSFNIEEKRNN